MRAGKGKRVSSREARAPGSRAEARDSGPASMRRVFVRAGPASACSPPTMSATVACPRSVFCYAYLVKCQ
jgi:hypothetical protein